MFWYCRFLYSLYYAKTPTFFKPVFVYYLSNIEIFCTDAEMHNLWVKKLLSILFNPSLLVS